MIGDKDKMDIDTIAGTGPGIPDDALGPDEELLKPPSDEEVDRVSRAIGATKEKGDDLPLDGE